MFRQLNRLRCHRTITTHSAPLAAQAAPLQAAPCTTGADNAASAARPELPITSCTVNGIRVATAHTVNFQHRHPLVRIAIAYRAGARHETSPEDVGCAHFLHRCAGLKSAGGSAFISTRTAQQTGVRCFARADRETITVCVVARPANICEALCCLKQVATEPFYRPWELELVRQLVRNDAQRLDDVGRSIDLLHAAAFRRGLGRSLLCPEYRLPAVCAPALHAYQRRTCQPDRCAVVALNVAETTVKQFVQSLHFGQQTEADKAVPPAPADTFHKDTRCVQTAGKWSHIALAAQTAGSTDRRDMLGLAILQQTMGCGSVTDCTTKVAPGAGVLPRAVGDALASCAGTGPALFRCEALHCSYAGAGLFGVQLSADGKSARAAIAAAVAVLRAGSLSEDDVRRGKQKLRAAMQFAAESEQRLLEEMAAQTVLGDAYVPVGQLLAEAEALSAVDVQATMKKLGCEWAMAAVGNLDDVPYVDEM